MAQLDGSKLNLCCNIQPDTRHIVRVRQGTCLASLSRATEFLAIGGYNKERWIHFIKPRGEALAHFQSC